MLLRVARASQAIKAIAIARQYVEEEAIDLCCRPEFVELSDAQLGDGSQARCSPPLPLALASSLAPPTLAAASMIVSVSSAVPCPLATPTPSPCLPPSTPLPPPSPPACMMVR